MCLNRDEFVRFASAEKKIPMTQINTAIDIFTDAVIDAMAAGNDVKLVGFGTFHLKARAARTGRNPKTKEAVNIPARVVPFFEPGAEMKTAVYESSNTNR